MSDNKEFKLNDKDFLPIIAGIDQSKTLYTDVKKDEMYGVTGYTLTKWKVSGPEFKVFVSVQGKSIFASVTNDLSKSLPYTFTYKVTIDGGFPDTTYKIIEHIDEIHFWCRERIVALERLKTKIAYHESGT